MPSSFKLFVASALARTYPRVAWLFRSRSWMIQETLLPVLSVAAFAYAYKSMNAPQAYTGFVVLGAAMTTFWLNVLWGMGAQLYWERDSGNLELYVMSPAPLMGVLTGMALGGMTTTLVRATAITVTGGLMFDAASAHELVLARDGVRPHTGGALWPWHEVRLGVSALGSRGVAPGESASGADLSTERDQLPDLDLLPGHWR